MRNALCKRVTGETDISMELNLDGTMRRRRNGVRVF